MKVAYFAESSADRAALTIFTEAILGKATEDVTHAGLEHRGWPTVRTVLPSVLKEIHYHTNAEGFVLVVDSNGSPTHVPEHEPPGQPERQCRLCQLQRIAREVMAQVRPRPHLPPLKIALGLAVPTIEAWLLCKQDSHVTEAAWINGMKDQRGRMPYTKGELKKQLYGTSHPSLAIETEAMMAAAERLSKNLQLLENLFPNGFGPFIRDLRKW